MKNKQSLTIHDTTRMAIKSDGTRIPVIDSPLSTIIQPNEEDIKNGIPGDHANCMYCLTVKRIFKSELAWVTRGLAYVELKNKEGKPELHRFILKDPARAKVKGFDRDKMSVTPEAVIFAAPVGKQTLDGIRAAWFKFKKRQKAGLVKRRAYVKGTVPDKKRDHSINELNTLRDPATGLFQFKVLKSAKP